MEELIQLDWEWTLWLNDWGNDGVDAFFNFITHKFYAIPLYLFLLYYLYKKLSLPQLVVVLVSIALMITLNDQTANLFKNDLVQRLRPFREPGLDGLLSKVGRSGGRYGFYSGHASNAIALATYLCLLLRTHNKWITGGLWIWASLVAYSRVYLGVHYLGDVIAGAIAGLLFGWLIYQLTRWFCQQKEWPLT